MIPDHARNFEDALEMNCSWLRPRDASVERWAFILGISDQHKTNASTSQFRMIWLNHGLDDIKVPIPSNNFLSLYMESDFYDTEGCNAGCIGPDAIRYGEYGWFAHGGALSKLELLAGHNVRWEQSAGSDMGRSNDFDKLSTLPSTKNVQTVKTSGL